MKRYILTSTKYEGQIVLVYGAAAELRSIDCTDWDGDPPAVAYLFNHLPRKLPELEHFVTNTLKTALLVEADLALTFDMFWNKYALKRNRKRCEALWNKLSKAKQVNAYNGVPKYDRYLKGLQWGRNKLDPDSYLSGERWEDDWK